MSDPHHIDVLHFAVKQHMQDRWRTLAQSLSSSDREFGEYFKAPIEVIAVQLIGLALDLLKLPRANAHRYLDYLKNMQEDNFRTKGCRGVPRDDGETHRGRTCRCQRALQLVTDRLCRDCRWAVIAVGLEFAKSTPHGWECRHEIARVMSEPDYVMGEPSQAHQLACISTRRDPNRCGVTGRFWEPRE